MSTFCWLPPDRLVSGVWSEGVRTRSRPSTRRASLRARLVSTMPIRFAYLGMCARITFSNTERVGTTPLSRRSSVSSAMPRRLASMGERMTSSRPLTRMVPEAIGAEAEDGLDELGALRSHETADAQDLAAMQPERDVPERARDGRGQRVDLEQHLARASRGGPGTGP